MADAVKIIKPSGSSSIEDRLNLLEKQFRQHNHADGITQPVWVGKVNQGSSNIVIPPSGGVLGEDASNGSALRMGGIDDSNTSPLQQTGYNNSFDYTSSSNDSNGKIYTAQQLTLPSVSSDRKITATSVKIYTSGNNSSRTWVVNIYKDNDGLPAGSLGGGSISMSSEGILTITMSVSALSPGSTYWIVVGTGGPANVGGGDIMLKYNDSASYQGKKLMFTTTGFANLSEVAHSSLYFVLTYKYTETPAHIYLCSAKTQGEVDRYMGIANKDATKGGDANFISTGFKTDYTDLIAGSPYYLSDSKGIISTTPGTVAQRVGYAYSDKILAIFK